MLKLALRDHIFSPKDPILIRSFLPEFVSEYDTLELSERQAFSALPQCLRGSAKEQFEAVRTIASSGDGGVTTFPEAVQYSLRTYATSGAILEAKLKLRDTRKRENELERTYSTRITTAASSCDNVQSSDEKITLLVYGLRDSIRTMVARYREPSGRASFLDVV